MSITDELREWVMENTTNNVFTCYPLKHEVCGTKERLLEIADFIDAEHEAMVSYWQGASYKDGYDEGFASADDWLGQHEDAMAEHGWVRLPVDADGVPIHVGDVMEERSGHTFEAASLMAFGGSDNWLVLSDPRNFSSFREPHDIRHHHAPTVEDVLREFADEVQRCCDTEDTIAEYAARLRLAEEDK